MKGKLYLIPCTLGDTPPENDIPDSVRSQVQHLRHFIVEKESTARRYIKKLLPSYPIQEAVLYPIDKHQPGQDYRKMLDAAENGHDMGLLSEAGCPCIADPGSEIVRLAQDSGITVKPLTGPSSILLSLMASGLNGQNFAFNGYLPFDKQARQKKLRELENKILREDQTQLFMDTPFRNNQLLSEVVQTCRPDLRLCIATDITLQQEKITTRSVAEWRQRLPDLHKRPVMFALGR